MGFRSQDIRLESPEKYIPISQISPNHVQPGASPGLNFSKILHEFFCVLSMKGSMPRISKNISKKVSQKAKILFMLSKAKCQLDNLLICLLICEFGT